MGEVRRVAKQCLTKMRSFSERFKMKTLSEIIEAVKDGEKPEYEDLL